MFEGKTKAALQLLSSHAKGDVLHLNDIIPSSNSSSSSPQTVLDSLISKHPPGQPVIPWSIIHPYEDPPQVHVHRAGESRSEARGNISFEGPIGADAENTSGGGGGPLEIGQPGPLSYLEASYYTLGPGVNNPAYPPPPPPSHRPCMYIQYFLIALLL